MAWTITMMSMGMSASDCIRVAPLRSVPKSSEARRPQRVAVAEEGQGDGVETIAGEKAPATL